VHLRVHVAVATKLTKLQWQSREAWQLEIYLMFSRACSKTSKLNFRFTLHQMLEI
jgi:hypothetical protein